MAWQDQVSDFPDLHQCFEFSFGDVTLIWATGWVFAFSFGFGELAEPE